MRAQSITDEKPTPLSLERFTPAQVALAAQAWPMRAAEELRSAAIFRGLRSGLRALVLGDPLDAALTAVIDDELRHTRLCVHMSHRLGAGAPAYDLRPVRERLATLATPELRVFCLLLVEAALGETLSTALFRAGARLATEPATHAALSAILPDEVRHARLGWEALRERLPHAAGSLRARLQREATWALAALERDVAIPALRWLEAERPFDPALAELGVLPPAVRVEEFYTTVERLLVPRLSELGLDGPRAWAERYRPTT